MERILLLVTCTNATNADKSEIKPLSNGGMHDLCFLALKDVLRECPAGSPDI